MSVHSTNDPCTSTFALAKLNSVGHANTPESNASGEITNDAGLSSESAAAPERSYQQNVESQHSFRPGAGGTSSVSDASSPESAIGIGARIANWFASIGESVISRFADSMLRAIIRRCADAQLPGEMETEISHNANLALGKFLSGNKVAAYRDAKALSHELDKYEYFTAYNKLEHELCTYSESLGISKMDQMTQAQRKKVGNCFKRAENYWEDNQPEDAMKELGKIRSFVDKQLPDPNHALGNRLALLDDPPNYVTDRTIQFARNSALSARKLVDQSKYKEAFAIVEQAEQRIRDDWDDDWDVDIAAIILGLQHQKADI